MSAMASDVARGTVVLFSGSDGSSRNDTWAWDGQLWTQVGDTGPSWRELSGAAYDFVSESVLLFGGFASEGPFRDTWAWDGAGWAQVEDTGPAARAGPAMAADPARKRVVLFGGGYADVVQTDTWEWDGHAWTQVGDTGPRAGVNAVMAFDAGSRTMLLFDETGLSWSWNGSVWTQVADGGPSPRFGTALCSMGTGVILFGGERKPPAGTPLPMPGVNLTSETWAWNAGQWRQIQDMGPEPRSHVGMAADKDGNVVLFGGQGRNGRLGDTWVLRPRP